MEKGFSEIKDDTLSQKDSLKKFIFRSRKKNSIEGERDFETVEVIVPERIQASYGLYVWPSAQILSWYLFEHREFLKGKRILELGAGTGLPGVLCSLLGSDVTLSDSKKLPHCLEQAKKTAEINGVAHKVNIIGITWGLFLHPLTQLKNKFDFIIGSDCLYDPEVFEDLLSTVSFLLENNPGAKFLTTYQERSADWSIISLLNNWELSCRHVPLSDLALDSQIDLTQLCGSTTIHLLEISKKQ